MGGLFGGGAKGMLVPSQIIAPWPPCPPFPTPMSCQYKYAIFKFSMRFISLQKCFSSDRLLPRNIRRVVINEWPGTGVKNYFAKLYRSTTVAATCITDRSCPFYCVKKTANTDILNVQCFVCISGV